MCWSLKLNDKSSLFFVPEAAESLSPGSRAEVKSQATKSILEVQESKKNWILLSPFIVVRELSTQLMNLGPIKNGFDL